MQRKRGAFPHRSITRKVSRGQSPLSSPLLCVTHEFTAIFDARNAQDIQGQSFRETSQPMFTLLTNHSRGELSNERVAQRLSRHFIIDCDKISPLATARRGKTWQTISSDSRVNVRACLPACVRTCVRALRHESISPNGNFPSLNQIFILPIIRVIRYIYRNG